MLRWPGQSKAHPIGLDIGGSSVKMLQLATVGESWVAVASGHYQLPATVEDDAQRQRLLGEAIARLLDSGVFRGRQVVANLPEPAVQYKNIRLPRMPASERDEAVRWEVVERLELAERNFDVQCLEAGEVRHGQELRSELIAMVAPQEAVKQRMELLLSAGLQPMALEPAPVSLARCVSREARREADQQNVRVLADVGRSTTKVVMLRGDRVVFFKPIEIGGRQLDEAVANKLDLSIEDASELRRKLSTDDVTAMSEPAPGEGDVLADHEPNDERSGEGRAADDPPAGDRPAEERRADDRGDEQVADEPLFGSSRRQSVRRAMNEAGRSIIGDLAREIGLCLRYLTVTFRGQRPGSIDLVGGEAHDPQIGRVIAEQLEIEVNAPNPLEGIDLSSRHVQLERRRPASAWALTAGLAMRPIASLSMRKRGAA